MVSGFLSLVGSWSFANSTARCLKSFLSGAKDVDRSVHPEYLLKIRVELGRVIAYQNAAPLGDEFPVSAQNETHHCSPIIPSHFVVVEINYHERNWG